MLTGVFDSLERDEAADIIKDLGGKTTTSLSKKTNYIVVGEEAGPAKLAKAEDLGTIVLSEDGLLDLIREKSGLPLKSAPKKAESPVKVKKEKDSPAKKPKSETKTTPIKKERTDTARTPEKEKKEIKIKSERKYSLTASFDFVA